MEFTSDFLAMFYFRSPHQHQQISPLGGGNSKIFYVHPLPAEMIQFDEPIFQMGGQQPPTSFAVFFLKNARHLNVMGSL